MTHFGDLFRRWNPAVSIAAAMAIGLAADRGRGQETPAKETVSTETAPSPEDLKAQLTRILSGGAPESVGELRAMEQLVREITARVSPATVGVQIGPAQGSGVIISADGYVLTAGHVSGRPNRDAIFILADGRQVKGTTLGINRSIDSGLMKITDPGEYPFVEMGDSVQLKAGQWCLAIGHPGGYQPDQQPVLRLGRILASRRDFIKTDCTLVGGDSGGPLFDLDGKVVGIHSRIGGELTANIHVPIKTYRDTWDRLVAKEIWGAALGSAPYIGVEGERDAKVAKLAKVFPGQPGDKAGLKPGDTIVRFDDEPVTDFASLANLVGARSPGDKVKVSVTRGEETVELELTIGAREE
jgi:serine protease Do